MAKASNNGLYIIFKKVSEKPPEYHLIMGLNIGTPRPIRYLARIIDDHYLLERSFESVNFPQYGVLGIAHTETEADSRLAKIARDEFVGKRNEIEHPTQEQAEHHRKWKKKYCPGVKPQKWKFIDETASK